MNSVQVTYRGQQCNAKVFLLYYYQFQTGRQAQISNVTSSKRFKIESVSRRQLLFKENHEQVASSKKKWFFFVFGALVHLEVYLREKSYPGKGLYSQNQERWKEICVRKSIINQTQRSNSIFLEVKRCDVLATTQSNLCLVSFTK